MMVQIGYYDPYVGDESSRRRIVLLDPSDPDAPPVFNEAAELHGKREFSRWDSPTHGDGPVFIARIHPTEFEVVGYKDAYVTSSSRIFTYTSRLNDGSKRVQHWRYIVNGSQWYQIATYQDGDSKYWDTDICSGKFGEVWGYRLPWGPSVPSYVKYSTYEEVLAYLEAEYCTGEPVGYDSFRSGQDGWTCKPGVVPIKECAFDFNDGQYSYWSSRAANLPYGGLRISTSCFGQAYYNAVKALPRLQQNMIANIVSCVSTIRSFKDGYKSILKASDIAKEAWLSYRYVYNTTVSDMTEFEKACERLLGLTQGNGVVASYGDAYDSRGAHYKCAVKCKSSSLLPNSMKSWAREANLRLDMMNIWDMIPFSFIVDWFADVGTILDGLDAWLQMPEYDISEIWYSYSEDRDVLTGHQSIYFRWEGNAPALPHFDWMSESSGKTIIMRFADTIALFF